MVRGAGITEWPLIRGRSLLCFFCAVLNLLFSAVTIVVRVTYSLACNWIPVNCTDSSNYLPVAHSDDHIVA